jgi:hypothetical protein
MAAPAGAAGIGIGGPVGPVMAAININPNPAELAGLQPYYGPQIDTIYASGNDFANQFERATALTFNDTNRVIVFGQKMKGPALAWLEALPKSEKVLWADLKTAFLLWAVPVGYTESLFDQFHNLKQENREFCGVYHSRLIAHQTKTNNNAIGLAGAAIAANITANKAAEDTAVITYRLNPTPVNKTAITNATTALRNSELAVPGRITDDMVLRQWRTHLNTALDRYVKFEFDPHSTKTMTELLDAVQLRERKMMDEGTLTKGITANELFQDGGGISNTYGVNETDHKGFYTNKHLKHGHNGNYSQGQNSFKYQKRENKVNDKLAPPGSSYKGKKYNPNYEKEKQARLNNQ